jgi:hypothetical protein
MSKIYSFSLEDIREILISMPNPPGAFGFSEYHSGYWHGANDALMHIVKMQDKVSTTEKQNDKK